MYDLKRLSPLEKVAFKRLIKLRREILNTYRFLENIQCPGAMNSMLKSLDEAKRYLFLTDKINDKMKNELF